MYFDIDWGLVIVTLAAYFGTPIALSVAAGITRGIVMRDVSVAWAAVLGFGIGLLGAFFFGFWGFLALWFGSVVDMSWAAILTILFAGLVAASFACIWGTWKAASGRSNAGWKDARAETHYACQ